MEIHKHPVIPPAQQNNQRIHGGGKNKSDKALRFSAKGISPGR